MGGRVLLELISLREDPVAVFKGARMKLGGDYIDCKSDGRGGRRRTSAMIEE